jgi:hypothetical protein
VPSALAIGVLGLPAGLFVLTRNVGQLDWIPRTSLHQLYRFFLNLTGGGYFAPGADYGRILLPMVYLIALLAAVTAIVSCGALDDAFDRWRFGFLFTWLLVPVALTLIVSIWKPVFEPNFLILCLPPMVLIASFGIASSKRRWVPVVFLISIAALSARELSLYYKWVGYQDWRTATDYVLSKAKPGDVAVFYPRHLENDFEYYREEFTSSTGIREVFPKLAESLRPDLTRQYARVWLIEREETETGAPQRASIKVALAANYPAKVENRFTGVVITLFSK